MILSAYLGVASLVDVGYRFYTTAEAPVAARITTGIVDAGDGWYSVDASIPATGNSVRWDSTGTAEAKAREYLDLFNDPLAKAVPDGYAAGTAGKILGDNLNAMVSTRATQTSMDTIGTNVTGIKGKTDNLPVDPADASDIAASFITVNGKLDAIDDYVDTEVAAIKAKTDTIPTNPASVGDIPTAIQNADALLKRDMAAVTGEASRSPLNAIRLLRNKWSAVETPNTLTVKKEDDTTTAWTAPLTTDSAAAPITGMDPT